MREPKQPDCTECGTELECRHCNDQRTRAEDIFAGWRILSPFGRWETVVRVEQPDQFGAIQVWTRETGDQVPWEFPRWRKLDAREPERNHVGEPEIRVFEYDYARDASMHVVATMNNDFSQAVLGDGTLASASFQRGEGWRVQHRAAPSKPGERGELVTSLHDSKAKARTELRRLARDYAKKMGGVKATLRHQERTNLR